LRTVRFDAGNLLPSPWAPLLSKKLATKPPDEPGAQVSAPQRTPTGGSAPSAVPTPVRLVQRRPPRRTIRLAVKRAFDLVASVAILLVLSPLYAGIAAMIWLDDGGPVIFRQTRLGRDGQPFTIYKFRTMVRDAERRKAGIEHTNERRGPLFKVADDPRVTRAGRWLRRTSLDELPQFLNVVEGTMSIIGPRPALPAEAEQFPAELRRRELMPQGITGLWQLDGQTDPDFGKYTELDLRYVDEWTLRMDLDIFVRTPAVLWRRCFGPR